MRAAPPDLDVVQAEPIAGHDTAPGGVAAIAARSRSALADALLATIGSRILVWCAGAIAVSTVGAIAFPGGITVPGINSGLGDVSARLVAPVANWDGSWYALIAQHGYFAAAGTPNLRVAFFPLYPLLVSILSWSGLPLVLAGALISTVCLGLGLYGMHRLVEMEVGLRSNGGRANGERAREAAQLATLALAVCPMAVFFSAVYSDALYLALSVGAFLYARRGRWSIACLLGGLGAAARANGILLLVPLVVLYLYGPREDLEPDRARTAHYVARPRLERLMPRYALRADFAWMLLVPLGLLVFLAYLAVNGADAMAPFHVEKVWGHQFLGPFGGIWDGAKSAFEDLGHVLSGRLHLEFLSTNPATGVITGWQNIMPFTFLVLTVPAIVGVARNLPAPYALYVVLAIVFAVSEPVATRPLQSVPRYEAVLFPMFMWLGIWLARHRAWQLPILGTSAVLAMLFAAEFATWHFVA